MKSLRHLFVSGNIQVIGGGGDDEKRLRLDGIVELETLENVGSRGTCAVDILKLSCLRRLKVTVLDEDSFSAVIHHMRRNENRSSLTHLSIADDSGWEIGRDVLKGVLIPSSLVVLNFWGCSISGGLPLYERGMCRNLVLVQLRSCVVGEEDVNVLQGFGNYPMLQLLHLEQMRFTKAQTVIFRTNSFPQLKSLKLFKLPDLEKLEVEVGAMLKLTELEIKSCRNLKKVPEGLRNIRTIRELKISEMPEAFNVRVRGEDNGSISHIPSLTLDYIVLQFS